VGGFAPFAGSPGYRTFDDLIVVCAARFRWPPDVVRRQSLRDLRLLMLHLEYAAAESEMR
jgi:hypothetical protein